MDDIIARYKYPRHNSYYRRRRRATKASSCSTAEKIARQVAISTLILLIVVVIRSIDTPITNYLTTKIINTLTTDFEYKKAYDSVKNFFVNLVKDPEIEEDNTPKEAVLGSKYEEDNKESNDSDDNYDNHEITVEKDEKDNDTIIHEIIEKYNFIAPLKGNLSSYFGERVDPITKKAKHHYGVDIDAGQGAEIKATLDGYVAKVQSEKEYGNYIKIDHGNELYTVYAHCSELLVEEGQNVKQGEVIARVGNTGLAIGSHLHFEIWKDGEALDPLYFVDLSSE